MQRKQVTDYPTWLRATAKRFTPASNWNGKYLQQTEGCDDRETYWSGRNVRRPQDDKHAHTIRHKSTTDTGDGCYLQGDTHWQSSTLLPLLSKRAKWTKTFFFFNKIHTSLHSLSPRPSLFISLPSPALITLLLGASNQNGRRRSLRGRSFHSAIAVVMPEETEREEGDGVGGTGWEGGGRA